VDNSGTVQPVCKWSAEGGERGGAAGAEMERIARITSFREGISWNVCGTRSTAAQTSWDLAAGYVLDAARLGLHALLLGFDDVVCRLRSSFFHSRMWACITSRIPAGRERSSLSKSSRSCFGRAIYLAVDAVVLAKVGEGMEWISRGCAARR